MNNTFNRRKFLYSLGAMGLIGGASLTVSKLGLTSKKEISQTKLLMGTFVSISARNEDYLLLENALENAFNTIQQAESIFSRHDANSALGILNAKGSIKDAPKELISLVETSLNYAKASNNVFNPAVVASLEALESYKVQNIADLSTQVQKELTVLSNPQNISLNGSSIAFLHSGMAISLDGIAKGHIADLAALELESMGVKDYMINAGGDIRLNSTEEDGAWRIAILDANDKTKHVQVLSLASGAIATSGNYDSIATKGYNHIVGNAHNTLSLTAIAPTCMEADALATTLFTMQEAQASQFIAKNSNYSYAKQSENNMHYSANWKA